MPSSVVYPQNYLNSAMTKTPFPGFLKSTGGICHLTGSELIVICCATFTNSTVVFQRHYSKIPNRKKDNGFIQLLWAVLFIVDYGMLYLLSDLISLHYIIAASIAFIAGLMVIYILNTRCFFRRQNLLIEWSKVFFEFFSRSLVYQFRAHSLSGIETGIAGYSFSDCPDCSFFCSRKKSRSMV